MPEASRELLLSREFGTIAELISVTARTRPDHPAVIDGGRTLSYGTFDAEIDRVAAALQRDGVGARKNIAICAASSFEYLCAFLGALRAGVTVAPLAPSSTPESLAAMVADCAACFLFADATTMGVLAVVDPATPRIMLDGSAGGQALHDWLAGAPAKPAAVTVGADWTFNLIYSSGTTGTPKGIAQPHQMRWFHVCRAAAFGYGTHARTMVSTPLYSNTTLVSVFPTLAHGGTLILMRKFDAAAFLALAAKERATHAMLVPVQYARIMARPDFDAHDLSSFKMKFSTSAPFAAVLKADVLKRWPGGLVEYYGMTEGGGTCMLVAHEFPDKLHTVGRPAEGHDIRLVDDAGREVAAGAMGEVVGHSEATMSGYHNQPGKTADAEWFDAQGRRFIRTGDVGRFDADGFLTLMDRKKDMIISGGFNVYPSDLEAVLVQHEDVAEAAVVGVPSQAWGETPVAFVTLRPGARLAPVALRDWTNAQLGKTQRLAALDIVDALPRSAIGKVLKRELRDGYKGSVA